MLPKIQKPKDEYVWVHRNLKLCVSKYHKQSQKINYKLWGNICYMNERGSFPYIQRTLTNQ